MSRINKCIVTKYRERELSSAPVSWSGWKYIFILSLNMDQSWNHTLILWILRISMILSGDLIAKLMGSPMCLVFCVQFSIGWLCILYKYVLVFMPYLHRFTWQARGFLYQYRGWWSSLMGDVLLEHKLPMRLSLSICTKLVGNGSSRMIFFFLWAFLRW